MLNYLPVLEIGVVCTASLTSNLTKLNYLKTIHIFTFSLKYNNNFDFL